MHANTAVGLLALACTRHVQSALSAAMQASLIPCLTVFAVSLRPWSELCRGLLPPGRGF